MTIQQQMVEYRDGETLFEGFMCSDDSAAESRPGILVAHAWAGRREFEQDKARQLAELGYVGFALDLYGKGVRGGSVEENRALMQPFMDDRGLLRRRMLLAVEQLRSQREVDGARIVAIGFCFGGLCVLDLARAGADVAGVVSFHGLLSAPRQTDKSDNEDNNRIRARVLVLHGWDDPLAPPQHLLALGQELTRRGADWQVHAYGNTMHAFTNPAANDADFGTVYQPDAERRSWQSMRNFLGEVLA